MNGSVMSAAQLLGRLLMALIFIRAGFYKSMSMDAVVGNLAHNGLPMPGVTYYFVVALELLGGLAVLVGFQTRVIAVVMAVYCVLTGVLVHFVPGNEGQMVHYFKNLCMAGGFLQLYVLGGGLWSLDAKMKR